jgi:hypothetical protein
MQSAALLAIWSDIDAASETDYLHWLTREHTTERITTSGFIAVRVFRAQIAEARRYLIVYELESAAALDGPDYVGKLNNPTPWSQRIMPQLRNFVRGGGRIVASAGAGRGGFAAALMLERIPPDSPSVVGNLAKADRVCCVTLMQTDQAKTGVATREKGMRKGDQSFAGLLLVDGLDEAAVTGACAQLEAAAPQPLYRQVFALERRMLRG